MTTAPEKTPATAVKTVSVTIDGVRSASPRTPW